MLTQWLVLEMATVFLLLSGICLVLNPQRRWPGPWASQGEAHQAQPGWLGSPTGCWLAQKEQLGSFVQSWGQPPAASTASRPADRNSGPRQPGAGDAAEPATAGGEAPRGFPNFCRGLAAPLPQPWGSRSPLGKLFPLRL